jgi:hypothetical protein
MRIHPLFFFPFVSLLLCFFASRRVVRSLAAPATPLSAPSPLASCCLAEMLLLPPMAPIFTDGIWVYRCSSVQSVAIDGEFQLGSVICG